MSYASHGYSLGAALLMATAGLITAAAGPMSEYEARVSGALELEIRGTAAEFGSVQSSGGPFVITLGAQAQDAAIVFTRWDGSQPRAGTYAITAEPDDFGIQALVVTGSITHPTGVFRARHGTVSITASEARSISGRFAMDAVGFLASDPDQADRKLSVRGSFTASPSR